MQDTVLIHVFAGVAAGVGFGLAQLPGSDAPVLVALQTAMILALADSTQVSLTRAAAAEMALTMAATMVGRGLSQVLMGWFPLAGNLLNALTAATVTEAVGWLALRWFLRERS
ncbi:MAG: hypothetical protein H6741_26670 [Alphaproteobacteria bacterium]|nr:hypothetical protein [Alphaproteobacteria bacterium]